jgi:hypothetical protein
MLISEIIGQTETIAKLIDIDLTTFSRLESSYRKAVAYSSDLLLFNSEIGNYPRSCFVPEAIFLLNSFATNVDRHITELRKLGTRDIDPDLDNRFKKLRRMRTQADHIKKKIIKIK